MSKCLQRKELERYLNGWTADSESQQIESHLANCSTCEETVNLLESETITGLPGVTPLHLNQTKDSSLPLVALSVTESTDREPSVQLPSFGNHPESDQTIQRSETISNQEQAPCNDPLQQALAEIRGWNGNEIRLSNQVFSELTPGDFGSYELLELIGRGGMAEVYRGRHKRLQREVAIKLLRVPSAWRQPSLERIEREIQAVGKLHHPAIVTAFDAGEHGGCQFLVTEFINGLDVGKIARANREMQVANACEIVRQAALGLDHAHSFGIIHRDIKPSNVMIDQNGKVKVLDFGLVRLDDSSLMPAEVTTVGQLLGTLDYMAPEQAERADQATYRSDIYSLGATLFRLLAGRAPYAATINQSPLEKLRLLAIEQPPKLLTLRPDLPDALCAIVDKTLARDPGERPASAAHLAEQLEPFSQGNDLANLVSQSLTNDSETAGLDCDESYFSTLRSVDVKGIADGLKKQPSKTKNRIWKWIAGLTMAGAGLAAGILLILETQKGRIVIESDEPNLKVALISDGKIRETVELVPGANTTRVFAGEYEVHIEGGTDRYEIENQKFVLKRGETVVARVRVEPREESSSEKMPRSNNDDLQSLKNGLIPSLHETRVMRLYRISSNLGFAERVLQGFTRMDSAITVETDSENQQIAIFATESQHADIARALDQLDQTRTVASPTSNAALELVYDGYPLEHWLNVIATETSYERRNVARNAIGTLARENESVRIVLRSKFAEIQLPSNSQHWLNWIIPFAGLDDKHAQVLLDRLKHSSDDEALNIVEMITHDLRYRNSNYREGETIFVHVFPMVDEILKRKWKPESISNQNRFISHLCVIIGAMSEMRDQFRSIETKSYGTNELFQFADKLFLEDWISDGLTNKYLSNYSQNPESEKFDLILEPLILKILDLLESPSTKDTRLSQLAMALKVAANRFALLMPSEKVQPVIKRSIAVANNRLKAIAESSEPMGAFTLESDHQNESFENQQLVSYVVSVKFSFDERYSSDSRMRTQYKHIALPVIELMDVLASIVRLSDETTQLQLETIEAVAKRSYSEQQPIIAIITELLGDGAIMEESQFDLGTTSFNAVTQEFVCFIRQLPYKKPHSKLNESEKRQFAENRSRVDPASGLVDLEKKPFTFRLDSKLVASWIIHKCAQYHLDNLRVQK